jgi:hypothetical protein
MGYKKSGSLPFFTPLELAHCVSQHLVPFNVYFDRWILIYKQIINDIWAC